MSIKTLDKINVRRLPLSSQSEFFDLKGQSCQARSLFADAKKNYLLAYQRYQSLHDVVGQIHIACRLGDVERQLENFSSAFRWYSLAIQLSKRNPHHATARTDAALGKALALRGMGKLAITARQLKPLLKIYQRTHDKTGLAHATWALGTTLRFLGELKEAERHLRTSVALYTQLNDSEGLAYAQCGLGGTLRMKGQAKESSQLYAQANKVFQKTGDLFGTAYSFCGRGNALRMQGLLKKSLGYSQRAKLLYESLHQKSPLAFVLWTLAQTNMASGNYSVAERHLIRAETLFKSVNDRRGLVYIDLGRGEILRHKKSNKAVSFYRRAIRGADHLNLRLEKVHGQRGLYLSQERGTNKSLVSLWASYQKCGVDLASFKTYSTLP